MVSESSLRAVAGFTDEVANTLAAQLGPGPWHVEKLEQLFSGANEDLEEEPASRSSSPAKGWRSDSPHRQWSLASPLRRRHTVGFASEAPSCDADDLEDDGLCQLSALVQTALRGDEEATKLQHLLRRTWHVAQALEQQRHRLQDEAAEAHKQAKLQSERVTSAENARVSAEAAEAAALSALEVAGQRQVTSRELIRRREEELEEARLRSEGLEGELARQAKAGAVDSDRVRRESDMFAYRPIAQDLQMLIDMPALDSKTVINSQAVNARFFKASLAGRERSRRDVEGAAGATWLESASGICFDESMHGCFGCCTLTVGVEATCFLSLLVQITIISLCSSAETLSLMGLKVSPEIQVICASWALAGMPVVIAAGVGVLYHVDHLLRTLFWYLVISFPLGISVSAWLLLSGKVCDSVVEDEIQRLGSVFVCGFTESFVFMWTTVAALLHAYLIYVVWSAAEEITEMTYNSVSLSAYSNKLQFMASMGQAAPEMKSVPVMNPGVSMAPREQDEAAPLPTEAYVIKAAGEAMELQSILLPPLTETQVEVEMSHCGLSRADLHMRDNDWGVSDFPLVLGHEGYGTVRKLGSKVQHLRVGDRVGVGWIRDSCRLCDACGEGMENLCETGYQGTFLGSSAGPFGKVPSNEFGGCFSKIVRVEEAFAFLLAPSLPPELACPLMGAGAAMYEALCSWVKPGSRVGIGSFGGLGTLGTQLAKKMAAKVTVFSASTGKREAALLVGADEFVDTASSASMMRAENSIDVFFDTSPVNTGLNQFMRLLKINGTFVRVGIPFASDAELQASWHPLIFSARKVVGSIACGRRRTKEMLHLVYNNLDFFSQSSAWTTSQIRPFSEVNEAMKQLQEQRMESFRIVLQWCSFKAFTRLRSRFAHSDTAAPAAAVPQSAGGAAMGNPQSFFPAPTSDVDFKSALPRDSVDVPTEEHFVRESPADKDVTPQSEKKPTPQSARSVGAPQSFFPSPSSGANFA
ncbi:adhC2 [Symbiodinium sp. CCMP2456]|nr:adhC2 [Symbiodinium sp. CCMP2456]